MLVFQCFRRHVPLGFWWAGYSRSIDFFACCGYISTLFIWIMIEINLLSEQPREHQIFEFLRGQKDQVFKGFDRDLRVIARLGNNPKIFEDTSMADVTRRVPMHRDFVRLFVEWGDGDPQKKPADFPLAITAFFSGTGRLMVAYEHESLSERVHAMTTHQRPELLACLGRIAAGEVPVEQPPPPLVLKEVKATGARVRSFLEQ